MHTPENNHNDAFSSNMTALRQRKGSKGREHPPGAELQSRQANCCTDHHPEKMLHGDWSWGAIVWTSVGWSVSVGLGLLCCIYVATLHENDLWFSNIKCESFNKKMQTGEHSKSVKHGVEVEREISFRTECGLYYSYYKQMLQAPSIQEGLSDLIHDNLTESKRTINLLQRMNIYQEVFLSVLYRLLPIQKVMVWLMYVTTFFFCLTWQFNQFILLVQALIIYTLDCVDFLTTTQSGLKTGSLLARLGKLLLHTAMVLLLTFTINYLAKVLYLFFTLLLDFDASLYLCEEAFGLLPFDTLERLAGTLLLYPYVLTLLLLGGMMAVSALHNLRPKGVSAEERKGAGEGHEAALRPDVAYNLLHTLFYGLLAFSTMSLRQLIFPLSPTLHAQDEVHMDGPHVCGGSLWCVRDRVVDSTSHHSALQQQSHATPCQICSSAGNDRVPVLQGMPFSWCFGFINVLSASLQSWGTLCKREENSELSASVCLFFNEDEMSSEDNMFQKSPLDTNYHFYGDTKTPKRAVFAGSMQLLAGVKLCTGRVVTNHPHYEDKDLRERTRQVYQVYARQSAEDVHDILRAAGADYVVLENSICYERRHRRGCRLRDLLDLANGHIMDGPGDNDPDLVPASHPRFCEAIKTDTADYAALFTRTFENKTFHVYRVKKKRKKSAKNSPEPVATQ
ncbi:hypothetical protein F2P81_004955 [Scophthalmus maximus]|uniref:SRCR domain-containing protein n=1 Tax=Scophthalmus maximus TaxID=52904 RepID=A0A6A4TGN5_SCOMX|nr:hypothetical protein F2P81_004955 [Scophthalmus maximus]